jgi:hypothetical protein
LAAAILIDATLVRAVALPAALTLIGERARRGARRQRVDNRAATDAYVGA